MTSMRTLDINAADMTFPPFRIILKRSVASGSLLRLATDGALPLKHLQVERMVCDGSELPPAHRRDRAEMEKNWGWYMKTKTMAVFRIKISGTTALTSIQIIHGGYTLAELPIEPDSDIADLEWADERPGRPLEDAWYYVRVRQADGHCAWLSPFWIDLPQ